MKTRSRGLAASLGAAGLAALLWAAAADGAARPALHADGPPPGHTGGFGEPTCRECHVGSPLNAPGSTLELLGLGSAWEPGATYELTVRLRSFEMLAAGFQAAIRWREGPRAGTSAGVLRALDERVTVVPATDAAVEYVQHAPAGAEADGELAEWTFGWTAPDDAGPLVLHVAANSGSGDNSPLDDLVYTLAATLRPTGR